MNDIEQILKIAIQAKVVEAFNSTPAAIDKLVEAAMSKEVNSYGQKPDYSDRAKMPYMEYLIGEEIRKAIRECVVEYVAANKPAINEKVKQSLLRGDYGSVMADAVIKILSDEWRWNVSLTVTPDTK